MESRFFGLQPSDKGSIILEPAFLLMYYCGFTYRETYALPVVYKKWFIERLSREMTRGSDDGSATSSRGAHHNPPDARALQGMSRTEGPSRLRRFT